MTDQSKWSKALEEAFLAALLLTSSSKAAEAFLRGGIAGLESDDISSDNLLLETAKATIERRTEFREEPEALSMLPFELWRLSLLAPSGRDCFLLRILIGLAAEVCAGIPRRSVLEIDDILCATLQDLPSIGTRDEGRLGRSFA